MKSKSKIIAVDFDGTCVTHEYPKVGKDIGAVPILKKLVAAGHKIILYTMRDHNELLDAINWFTSNGIPLYGVNINPTQQNWTTSPKIYAHVYIDDAALGCPLIYDVNELRPYVDWEQVELLLNEGGIL